MSTSSPEPRTAKATRVKVTKAELEVELEDGRTVTVPVGWFPRLAHGTAQERAHWRLIAGGNGIHWPDLDEDISVEGLLSGHSSGESQSSFQRWLDDRGQGRPNKRLPRTGARKKLNKRTSPRRTLSANGSKSRRGSPRR